SVAGAIQENDKGTIVGRRSYGKGLVQREMELGDGSAVRLTVSRYYTPTGRSIQRSYQNGNSDYYDDYFERLQSGELLDPEKIEVADSLKFTTPKGKIVYGGGGIIPDVFVPLNLSIRNETLNYIREIGLIGYFVFEEIYNDMSSYNGFSQQDFISNVKVGDNMLIRYHENLNDTHKANVTLVADKKEMKQLIKAALVDQLYDSNASEEILHATDEMIKEV